MSNIKSYLSATLDAHLKSQKAYISNQGFQSSTVIEYSSKVEPTKTDYSTTYEITVPYDGYMIARTYMNSADGWISISGHNGSTTAISTNTILGSLSLNSCLTLPVAKGMLVTVSFSASVSPSWVRYVPSRGSV